MKKLLSLLTLVLLLTGSFFSGRLTAGQPQTTQQQQNNKIEVIGIYTDVETATANNFYIDKGEIAVEFSDSSFALINESKNYYSFTPATLGDWDLEFSNIDQLENCIETYISIAETGKY